MTKSELIAVINTKLPEMEFQNIELAVNCMLSHMANVLEEGERIEVRGFGSFNLHHSSPRLARNPKTGETLHIPVKTIIHFKAGKQMRDRVNASHGKRDIIK
jgi:integration host factor subunit beta